MTTCPHCGQFNETGRETCSGCGAVLTPPEGIVVSPTPEQIPIPDVRVGDFFKIGWEIFKRYPGGFIGYFLVVSVISYLLHSVPRIGGAIAFVLAVPFNAGFFVVSAKFLKNQVVEFADFFTGFKFLLQLALLGVVSSILILIGFILLIVPGIYLAVGYAFAQMFVMDRGLDFWPAMETSRRSVGTRWFRIFSLFLLLLLLNLGGLLALGVGLVVTVPLTYCILATAYADIFGIKSAHLISMRQ